MRQILMCHICTHRHAHTRTQTSTLNHSHGHTLIHTYTHTCARERTHTHMYLPDYSYLVDGNDVFSLNLLNVQKLKSGRLQFTAPTPHIKVYTGTHT